MAKLQFLQMKIGDSFIYDVEKTLLTARSDCRYWSAILGRDFVCETVQNNEIRVVRHKNIRGAKPLVTETQIRIYLEQAKK